MHLKVLRYDLLSVVNILPLKKNQQREKDIIEDLVLTAVNIALKSHFLASVFNSCLAISCEGRPDACNLRDQRIRMFEKWNSLPFLFL